jgi:ABC-2 type transport system permease protein
MWAIVRWSLWQRRWSRFWWIIGIVLTVVLVLALYPSIRDQAAQLNKSFSGFSNSTLSLFGGTDFFSPVGYLNSQLVYFTLPLLLIILSINVGMSMGREEANGTLETLLARPITRTQVLTAKALSGIMDLFIVTLVGSVVTVLMAAVVNMKIPLIYIVAACFACFMLVLTFWGVAFLLAATGRGRVAALGIAAVYAMGGYLIGSLSGTVHWLHNPSLIFPYHYYQTADILRGTFRWSSIIFFMVFTLACFVLSWLSFRRRDLV